MEDQASEGRGAYLRSGWFLRRVANPVLMKLGLVPTLAVRGRKTGRWRTVPVNLLKLDDAWYLVAPGGDTDWVRNLRAAGMGELRRGGHAKPFRAFEVADEQKPPVIDAYLERWGSRVRGLFRELPNPADHPVFRIDPT
jgi:deazaflavin-dependent oxidoreductase (nitroreductase family)